MTLSIQCISCARYRSLGECAAFPEGIPSDIIDGEFDHREPHEGDHGLQWIKSSGVRRTDDKLAYPQT
jgi:hypothetical protein